MKLMQYAAAYAALLAISDIDFPYKTSFAIVRMKQKIEPKYHFFTSEEMKLAVKYGVLRPDGTLDVKNGSFEFRGNDENERKKNAAEYTKKRNELCNVEDNEAFERPILRFPAGIKLKPLIIEALDGFCEFEADENAD